MKKALNCIPTDNPWDAMKVRIQILGTVPNEVRHPFPNHCRDTKIHIDLQKSGKIDFQIDTQTNIKTLRHPDRYPDRQAYI